MKTVWITALTRDDARMSGVAATLRKYGLQAQGHVWLDEPDKAVARAVQDAMQAARSDAWIVLVDESRLASASVRYGLSLLRASLQTARGAALPLVCLWPNGAADGAPGTHALPPLLGDALVAKDAGVWAAKLIAALARPPVRTPAPALGGYRLALWGNENIGQWLEIGTSAIGTSSTGMSASTLAGFAFGLPTTSSTGTASEASAAAPARIEFQAVGPQGALPEKTTLEYAQEGLQLRVGEHDYLSWAVRNTITPDQSYFVRIRGTPRSLLCMPYPEGDEVEATVIRLV